MACSRICDGYIHVCTHGTDAYTYLYAYAHTDGACICAHVRVVAYMHMHTCTHVHVNIRTGKCKDEYNVTYMHVRIH
jgi:hypothetical protein